MRTYPPYLTTPCWWFIVILSRVMAFLFCRVKVVGKKPVPKGKILLVANHISHFDPPAMVWWFTRKVDYMAMKELFTKGAGETFFSLLDVIPLERGRADASAVRTAVERLKAGGAVFVFPEGGLRSGENSVLGGAPLPAGAASLAQMASAPVLPCVILGTDQLYVKANLRRRPRILIAVGDVLQLDDSLPRQEARAELNGRIEKALRELHEQLKALPEYSDDLIPLTAQERWERGR